MCLYTREKYQKNPTALVFRHKPHTFFDEKHTFVKIMSWNRQYFSTAQRKTVQIQKTYVAFNLDKINTGYYNVISKITIQKILRIFTLHLYSDFIVMTRFITTYNFRDFEIRYVLPSFIRHDRVRFLLLYIWAQLHCFFLFKKRQWLGLLFEYI